MSPEDISVPKTKSFLFHSQLDPRIHLRKRQDSSTHPLILPFLYFTLSQQLHYHLQLLLFLSSLTTSFVSFSLEIRSIYESGSISTFLFLSFSRWSLESLRCLLRSRDDEEARIAKEPFSFPFRDGRDVSQHSSRDEIRWNWSDEVDEWGGKIEGNQWKSERMWIPTTIWWTRHCSISFPFSFMCLT